jgi:hypothetical protein
LNYSHSVNHHCQPQQQQQQQQEWSVHFAYRGRAPM